jgi:hypothetical protein
LFIAITSNKNREDMLTQITHVTSKTTKAILVRTISLLIIVALFSVVFFLNQASNNPSLVGYWILDISTGLPEGLGNVQPNGTVHLPMNQTGINVTAVATGINGFISGNLMENAWKINHL